MKTEEAVAARQAAVPRIDPDAILLDKWHNGSEDAFAELVERHHTAMVRLARSYVSPAQAEEIAQESWIAVLKGAERFQRRSSFKTWIFRVVINRALTEAAKEARAHLDAPGEPEKLTEAWHFYPDHHAKAGNWLVPPRPWTPEERMQTRQTLGCIELAIATLPALQQRVVTLRDVEGWTSAEVCELLGISEANQRVLLHRARIKLRNALEDFFSVKETS